ncbi:MAG: SPOR domain-containing protein [Balneola sp.]
MLIDNEKFIGLLVENSGLAKDKVEKYLKELIDDIKTAFDEGEGYEVDGFGIFSKLGSNILFIPSEELETEINYKYVGMEPIELPGGEVEESPNSEEELEENPIQGILDGNKPEEESDEYEDPFAELFNEAEEHESRSQEEELEDEDIEAVVEEEIENEDQEEDIFSEIVEDLEEKTETPSLVEEEIEETSVKGEQEEISETSEELDAEKEEEKAGPDQWGIDAHKEDDQEDAFSGLFGEDATEGSELVDEEDIFASEDEMEDLQNEENHIDETESESEEEIDFSALEESADDAKTNDFDDPFAELENEEEEDFVPVVTNVSSGNVPKSKEKDNESDEADEDEAASDTKKEKRLKTPKDRKQNSPVFLYMILALVILGGTGYILAYFGIIDIDGVTPPKYKTQMAQTTPPVNQPNSTPPQINQPQEEQPPVKTLPEVTEEKAASESGDENLSTANEERASNENSEQESGQQQETNPRENDLAPLVADEKAPGNAGIITPVNDQTDEEPYGLKGTVTGTGNNGYTIVLYTLSRKAGADAQFKKLTEDGYRTIIKERPSEQYGTLYRISIGQFKSLTDAAIAAEQVDSSLLGNYIITKI